MRRAFKFRLYPTANQARELGIMVETHRRLYNAALEQRKLAEALLVLELLAEEPRATSERTEESIGRLLAEPGCLVRVPDQLGVDPVQERVHGGYVVALAAPRGAGERGGVHVGGCQARLILAPRDRHCRSFHPKSSART